MTAPYTKLAEQPAQRATDMLTKYSAVERMEVGSHSVAPDPYDVVAPGIYPDEVVYQLDTGEKVAVSVEREWHGNGVGLAAYARVIEDDGSTTKLNGDKPLEVSFSQNINTVMAQTYTVDALAKDCALLLLGAEPITMDENDLPVINLEPWAKDAASIRTHIGLVAQVDSDPLIEL